MLISFRLERHLELVELVEEARFGARVGGQLLEAVQDAAPHGERGGLDEHLQRGALAGELVRLVGVLAGDEVARHGLGEVVHERQLQEATSVEVGARFGNGEREEGDAPRVVGHALGARHAGAQPAAAGLVLEGEGGAQEVHGSGVHDRGMAGRAESLRGCSERKG